MNYEEALLYLENLNSFGIKLGLERIKNLVQLLGNPQDQYKTIHITGTNGKGSTTAMLAKILMESGIKAGMYSSPHLISYTERMKIGDTEISTTDFAETITVVSKAVTKMLEGGDESPTQFEVLTAAAFYYFAQQKVEYAVIEVGLGGLLDSTNIIMPEVSVITNIEMDHADRCGGSIESIAENKAGIIKDNIPLVVGIENDTIEIVEKLFSNGNTHFLEMSGGDVNPTELVASIINQKENLAKLENAPFGFYSVTPIDKVLAAEGIKPGVVFCLKNIRTGTEAVQVDSNYPLAPYFLVYVSDNAVVELNFTQSKKIIDLLKRQAFTHTTVASQAVELMESRTRHGQDMEHYQHLLAVAVDNIAGKSEEKGIESLFIRGGTVLSATSSQGIEDFAVVSYLILTDNSGGES